MEKQIFRFMLGMGLLVLTACGKPSGFNATERPLVRVAPEQSAIPSSPSPVPTKAGEIVRRSGKIKAKDLRGTWDKSIFTLEGEIQIFDHTPQKMVLTGDVHDGSANLVPAADAVEKSIRAKAYCYSDNEPCTDFFVEFFAMDLDHIIYHDQFVVITPQIISQATPTTMAVRPTVKPKLPTSKKVEHEIDDDVQDGIDTGFVGAPTDIAKALFDPQPSPETPKPQADVKVRNQAVDYCSSGRLQNATDFKAESKTSSAAFKIYKPDRSNAFGTKRLLDVVNEMGQFVSKTLPGSKLTVGSISSKSGGKQSGHKSHQNGTDADISYLVNNSQLEFGNVVTKSGVSSSLLVSETWSLFKFAFLTGKVEMIFTDAKIKKALCAEAIAKGDLKDAQDRGLGYNILSQIRIIENHDNHFHLRIKCGEENPLCKTRSYKDLDSGCFAAGK
jgi:murein endopeptidase